MVNKTKPFLNIGPGEFIKEELELRGWSQQDLASILGLSLQTVHKLIHNKQPITLEVARRLSKAFGQSPQYWLNLDNNYRLRLEEETAEEQNTGIRAQLFKYMPLREMCKKGWLLCDLTDTTRLVQEVKAFWEIDELDFSFIDRELLPNFRRSRAYQQFDAYYALTWFKMAQKCARLYSVSAYNRQKLIRLTEQLHRFTVQERGIQEFLERLEQTGVKFFLLSHLPKTYADGAAFFMEGNPVVVYTKRYDRIDNFWFTIAHELAHVILHFNNRKSIFIDRLDQIESEEEKEADELASRWLKTKSILNYFEQYKKYISRFRVQQCSTELEIHPGIIVGVLQHHGYLSHKNLNKFKGKVSPLIPSKYFAEDRMQKIRSAV